MSTKKLSKAMRRPTKKVAPKAKSKAPSGNTYSWNVHKFLDVVAAKEAFDIHETRGFRAFALDAKGNKASKMSEFDPSIGAMLFVKS